MQAGECGQSTQTAFRHIQHVVAIVSGPIDIFTSKGQTQVQACRALEPYEIDLRDNARRNGMLLSQGNADSEEFHIVAEFFGRLTRSVGTVTDNLASPAWTKTDL